MYQYLHYLEEGIPEELLFSLVYQGAHGIPYKKYSLHDFQRCLKNCAVHVSQHLQVEVTPNYIDTLRELIREICRQYCFRAKDRDLLEGSFDFLPLCCQLSLGYQDTRERPPPNLSSLLSSQVAINT